MGAKRDPDEDCSWLTREELDRLGRQIGGFELASDLEKLEADLR